MSKKYGFGGVPRLVDIISAIPDDYKKALLPKLKARPIRTASGVCPSSLGGRICSPRRQDRSSSSNVQAPSVSAHRHDWKHLCVRKSTHCPELLIQFASRYCPGGPDSDFDYSTQSYTGYEPTSMRAIRARYDPYEQTRGRVEQLKSLGHNVDKVGCNVARVGLFSLNILRRSNLSSWGAHS